MLGYILTPVVQGDATNGPRPVVIDIVEGVGVGMPGVSAVQASPMNLTPYESLGPHEAVVINLVESVGVSQGIGSARTTKLDFGYGVIVTDNVQVITSNPL